MNVFTRDMYMFFHVNFHTLYINIILKHVFIRHVSFHLKYFFHNQNLQQNKTTLINELAQVARILHTTKAKQKYKISSVFVSCNSKIIKVQ